MYRKVNACMSTYIGINDCDDGTEIFFFSKISLINRSEIFICIIFNLKKKICIYNVNNCSKYTIKYNIYYIWQLQTSIYIIYAK